MTAQSERLAARGLKPAAKLAESKPHGDRLRYMAGCRCQDCRRANSAYESARQKARAAGDWNGIVPAAKARLHMKALSEQSVGRRTVADVSGVADSVLTEIIAGRKTHIRARTERAILSVTVAAAADRALVDAGASWEKLNALIKDGYSKTELAYGLGMKTHALQVGKTLVTVRKAFEIGRLFDRLKMVDAARSEAALNELKNEGYSSVVIEQRMSQLAEQSGVNLTWPLIRHGRIREKVESLVFKLHDALVGGNAGGSVLVANGDLEMPPEVLQAGLAKGRYRYVEGALHKRCNKCREYWPADTEFFFSAKDARHKDGLNDCCKACYATYWPNGRS